MSNKNRDTKPLEGYTIENNLTPDEAADRFANKWPHVAMKCARESFLSGYNWQLLQYTERGEEKIYKNIKQTQGFTIGKEYKDHGDGWFYDDLGNSHGIVQSILGECFEVVTTPSTSTTIDT